MATKKKAVKAKKEETKPEKIWISVLDYNGKVDHREVTSKDIFYNAAMNCGAYSLSKSAAELVWENSDLLTQKLRKLHNEILASVEIEVNVEVIEKKKTKKSVNKVKPKAKKK